MGNCLYPFSQNIDSSMVLSVAKHEKVLRVVKTDGKVLEFGKQVLVKDILVKFSGSGIGLSKEAVEHLPPGYELKLGNVYYILPPSSCISTISGPVVSAVSDTEQSTAGGVKRIKVVITKQQLQQLLTKQTSLNEVLMEPQRNSSSSSRCKSLLESTTNWKPKLEPIQEDCEQ